MWERLQSTRTWGRPPDRCLLAVLAIFFLLIKVISSDIGKDTGDRGCPYLTGSFCLSQGYNQTTFEGEDASDDLIRTITGNLLPEKTFCIVTENHSSIIWVVCDGGRWAVYSGLFVNITDFLPHLRLKKSVVSFYQVKNVQDQEQDDKPPEIVCPAIPSLIITEAGQTTAAVSWSPPNITYRDVSDVSVRQTQGPPSGSQFPEGQHIIAYQASDRQGQTGICSVNVTILVRQCPFEYTYILNGTVMCSVSGRSYIYGSHCTYTCTRGYTLSGPSSLSCEPDGTWSGSKPECKAISCGPPVGIEHGYVACKTSQFTYPSDCEILCEDGFELVGTSHVTCLDSGQWTTGGQCQIKHCEEINSTDHAVINCTNQNMYGSICSTSCVDPYQLKGSSLRTCQANEAWSGDIPVCEKTCQNLPAVSHGKFLCSNGQGIQDSCSLVCDEGFNSTEPVNVTCDSNYNWTTHGICVDNEAPLVAENCPAEMTVTATKLGIANRVFYSLPIFTDNSGETATIVGRPAPGAIFPIGTTEVTILASDPTGNTATCHFNITVIAKMCTDPNAVLSSSDPLKFNCPDGHIYGSMCTASCNGTQLSNRNITCGLSYAYNEPEWTSDSWPYCSEICGPGQWSSTGRQPCQLCGMSTYESGYGSRNCSLCPFMMVTPRAGAVSVEECQFVSYYIEPSLHPPQINLSEPNPSSFTLLLWLRVDRPDNSRMTVKFTMQRKNAGDSYAIVNLGECNVYAFYQEDTSSTSIAYWYHVVYVYDIVGTGGRAILIVNGEVAETSYGLSTSPLTSRIFTFGFTGQINDFYQYSLIVSALQLSSQALDAETLRAFYNSCNKRVDNNLLVVDSPIPVSEWGPRYFPLTKCPNRDYCAGNPCNSHGTCLNEGDGFSCLCSQQWSGSGCQIPPDFCLNNLCANGATCRSHSDFSNYSCICPDHFKGQYCQDTIVNGGWGSWTEWSSCSKICGEGVRSRSRVCDNPRPDESGLSCPGDKEQSQKCFGDVCPVNGGYGEWSQWTACSTSCGCCGVQSRRRVCDSPNPEHGGSPCKENSEESHPCNRVGCPECSHLVPRSRNNQTLEQVVSRQNSSDGDLLTYQIVCPAGHILVPPMTNIIQCGFLTNYTWTHQTNNNPTAILPACARLTQPMSGSLHIKYFYNNSSLKVPKNMSKSIEQNVHDKFLNRSSECEVNVAVTNVSNDTSQTDILTVDITYYTNTSTGSKEDSSLIDLAPLVESLSLQAVNTDGVDHIETSTQILQCHVGSEYLSGACVECPPGSLSPGNSSCVLCQLNTYQDEAGSTSCKQCPQCSYTVEKGADSADLCQPGQCEDISKAASDVDSPNLTSLYVGLAVGLSLLFIVILVVVLVVKRRLRRPKQVHVYSIPGATTITNEYVYETPLQQNIYDEIPNTDVYSLVQTSTTGDSAVGSSNSVKIRNDTSESYTELLDCSSSNDSSSKKTNSFSLICDKSYVSLEDCSEMENHKIIVLL